MTQVLVQPTVAKNFWIGTLIFVGMAIVVSIVLPLYVRSQTKDKSMVSSNAW